MRHLVIVSLVLCAGGLLASCNPYRYSSHVILVQKKGHQAENYSLLSVRDSSIVAIEATDDAAEPAFTHAEVIPFDSIRTILRAPDRPVIKDPTAERISLGLVGLGIGVGSYALLARTHRNSGPFESEDIMLDMVGYCGMATAIYSIAVAIFPSSKMLGAPKYKEINPRNEDDNYFLRTISAYPEGEPELLKHVL